MCLRNPPPLGTGALVPTNIMLMLDNSGSMAWDLSGNQLTSNSFLKHPTDINVDSKGNIYVWSSSNTVIEGKNYKMLVFNPDGTFKKAMIEYNQMDKLILIKHAENLTVPILNLIFIMIKFII